MKKLLMTYDGRISRSQYWMALLYYLGAMVAASAVVFVIAQVIPGDASADGGFSVSGVRAIPFVIVVFACIGFLVWSGICVGIKRCHDRDKSGWWMLIQLVPVIGPFWYFIGAFCLRGTVGPNRFGEDPLAS